ncbi:hypothetical protein M8494_09030 [Serratia ureilytica]
MAAVRGMVKALLETHRQRLAAGEPALFDRVYRTAKRRRRGLSGAQVDATEWQDHYRAVGLERGAAAPAAATYRGAERVICTGRWA